MDYINILKTVAELIVGGFIIWGFFNEDKCVKFERKLFSALCRKFRRSRTAYSYPSKCSYTVINGNANYDKIA